MQMIPLPQATTMKGRNIIQFHWICGNSKKIQTTFSATLFRIIAIFYGYLQEWWIFVGRRWKKKRAGGDTFNWKTLPWLFGDSERGVYENFGVGWYYKLITTGDGGPFHQLEWFTSMQ